MRQQSGNRLPVGTQEFKSNILMIYTWPGGKGYDELLIHCALQSWFESHIVACFLLVFFKTIQGQKIMMISKLLIIILLMNNTFPGFCTSYKMVLYRRGLRPSCALTLWLFCKLNISEGLYLNSLLKSYGECRIDLYKSYWVLGMNDTGYEGHWVWRTPDMKDTGYEWHWVRRTLGKKDTGYEGHWIWRTLDMKDHWDRHVYLHLTSTRTRFRLPFRHIRRFKNRQVTQKFTHE